MCCKNKVYFQIYSHSSICLRFLAVTLLCFQKIHRRQSNTTLVTKQFPSWWNKIFSSLKHNRNIKERKPFSHTYIYLSLFFLLCCIVLLTSSQSFKPLHITFLEYYGDGNEKNEDTAICLKVEDKTLLSLYTKSNPELFQNPAINSEYIDFPYISIQSLKAGYRPP